MSKVARIFTWICAFIACSALISFGLIACSGVTASTIMQSKWHPLSFREGRNQTSTPGAVETTPTSEPGSFNLTPTPSLHNGLTPGTSNYISTHSTTVQASCPSPSELNAASVGVAGTPTITPASPTGTAISGTAVATTTPGTTGTAIATSAAAIAGTATPGAAAAPTGTVEATPAIVFPSPAATAAATPSATASSAAPSPTAGTAQATGSLKSYSGNGYSISYPPAWNVYQNKNTVIFTDATNTSGLAATSSSNSSGGSVSAQGVLSAETSAIKSTLINVQDCEVNATTSLAGATWNQKAFMGDRNGSEMAYVVMTASYPETGSNAKLYSIAYFAPVDKYGQMATAYIQPMLKSFLFVA